MTDWLKPGDRLSVVAPSGALKNLDIFQQGLEIWKSQGYSLDLGFGVDSRWGYLAGKDSERQQQLLMALADPDCQGVLCARGGYGAARVLEGLGTLPPISHRKFLIGFSDITALLWGLRHQSIGVHGPVLTTLAQEPTESLQRLFKWLETGYLDPLQGQGWGVGQAQGWLLPGNLTVATHLLGTPYQPDVTGAILAFEDVNEEPYRIDRMLTQWRMLGLFDRIRGIALGRFSQWQRSFSSDSFTLEEVLRDRLGDLGIPVVSDLPFGHDGPNMMLPVGVTVTLDADRGILSFDASNSLKSP
ncbi:MAG: LD-carboxypeptidase [Microcoleaceae cyanobacterium]